MICFDEHLKLPPALQYISIIRIFEVNPDSRATEHRMSIVFTSSVSVLPHGEERKIISSLRVDIAYAAGSRSQWLR